MAINAKDIIEHLKNGDKLVGSRFHEFNIITDRGYAIKASKASVNKLLKLNLIKKSDVANSFEYVLI